jgi:hypothetical protein
MIHVHIVECQNGTYLPPSIVKLGSPPQRDNKLLVLRFGYAYACPHYVSLRKVAKQECFPTTGTPLMANMQSVGTLTSGLQIDVFGEDLDGLQFIEHTRTLIVSRDGATIPMARKLAPDSEVIIRNPATNKESAARVVGFVHDARFLQVYGIVFMDSSVNLWQVEIPEMKSQTTIVMECARCHEVDAVLLSEIGLAVFESTQALVRQCRYDNSSTTWKQTDRRVSDRGATERRLSDPQREIASLGIPAEHSPQERRRGKRTAMKAAGCLRCYGAEFSFECEDVSRGGFRFKSRETYPAGMSIEAAVPFARNSINIFVAARIVYHQELPHGFHRYGVAYIGSIKQPDSQS